MLTGRKLHKEYFSSVYLSKGEMHAILALSGNFPLLKLLLIVMANGLLKTFADSFISFGGILSMPVDFLSIFLKSCSTLRVETFGRWLFPAVRYFSVILFYGFDTFIISKRITNYFHNKLLLLSSISCSFARLVGLVTQERSTIFM